jgi:hypothetical protein
MRQANIDRVRQRLDVLNPGLAEHIRSVRDNATLRLFACRCASLALAYCGNGDQRSLQAVEVGQQYAKGLANDDDLSKVRVDSEHAADDADFAASKALIALEEGKASQFSKAFGAARAAFSAWYCCEESALAAAEDTAYETWAALRTVIEAGGTLDGLVPSNLSDTEIDAFIVRLLRSILSEMESCTG